MNPQGLSSAPDRSPASWLEQHGDFLYRYAVSRVREREVAEDLVQETFLGALRTRDSYQGNASERTWLVSILKHKVLDHLRRKYANHATASLDNDLLEEELFDSSGHWKKPPCSWARPEAALEQAEFWSTFSGCLGKLPGRLAQAFSLVEIDELAGAEACKVLAVSPSNLWVMLHRARLRLAVCLQRNWFAGEEKRS